MADVAAEAESEPQERSLNKAEKKQFLEAFLQRRHKSAATARAMIGRGSCERDSGAEDDLSAVIPEPDYSDSEEENRQARANCARPAAMTSDGVVLPRRLPNPCKANTERQQLHRELAFNQKIGKNVLGQKSELQKAMEKHRDQQQRKEEELKMRNNKSSFELAMEERLMRVEPKITDDTQTVKEATPEFLRVHARVRSKVNTPS